MATSATPGRLLTVAMSPMAKTSGCPGSERSGSTWIRPARSSSAPLAVGQLGGQRRGLDPGRPDRRVRLDPRLAAIGVRRRRRRTHRPDDTGAHPQLDAGALQLLGRLAGEAIAERGERLLPTVEQQHAHRRRIERAELALEAAHRQLAHLSRQLDPGRPGADDDHGQPLLALGGIVLDRRHLEGAEDPPAQLEGVVDRLHARRVSGPARRDRSTTGSRRRRR